MQQQQLLEVAKKQGGVVGRRSCSLPKQIPLFCWCFLAPGSRHNGGRCAPPPSCPGGRSMEEEAAAAAAVCAAS